MIGKLIALSKNGEEKGSLPVVNLHFFIGSDLFCDLRINHKDIAAQHCLITSQKNKPAVIRNLSRTVPTLVNNTEIGSSDVELKDNDIISIRHKNYKWCYNSSPTPSTSSHTSFVVSSKNRKSWPLFKNKLVAVVTPQRRDEQNETLPRKRRGTVAEENISKSKSTPKILAIKSGLRATTKQNLRKRKSSVKISPNTVSIERTPKVLPTLSRKSVKFLDVSGPRSRLGTRGRNSSNATPYKRTPKKKVSVYATPPSSLGRKKPIKSILKTPRSSSTTPRKDELNEQRLLSTSDILATPLPNVPEIIINSPSPAVNELLKTPEKGEQPEIVMRSSRRKAAIVRSPPSTPKSITKKRKSPEEKSIEASERAAKKLKQCPPHAIDKKKRAALLQCHRKSLTPHPVARRSGKLITSFPSSLSRRLEINSPIRSKFSSFPSISDSLKLPTDSLTPTVFKYTDSEMNLHNTTASLDKLKPVSRKKSNKSFSKETSPINRKFTRASRAARISNNLPQKAEATDVLSALDLSRRWPSPLQGEVSGNSSSNDVSNLSGFKKLFSADKTLDVRELFLEKNSESDILTGKSFQDLPETLSGRVSRQSAMSTEKSFQSLPETLSGRVSRQSAILKGKQSTDIDEFMHSFQSEGAQDQPYSTSLLSGSLSSFPSYSSTSRRSLSLKRGRKSTLSPKDISGSNVEHRTEERRSSENIATQSSDIKILSPSVSRKGRRSLNILNGSSLENNQLMESSNSSNTNETTKNSVDKINVSSSLNEMPSKSFGDCKVNTKGSNDTSLDVSAFSLGSFNYSYHKSKSGDSLSLLQTSDVNAIDEETYLEDSMENGIAKDVLVKTPIASKAQSKGRISLRRAVLLASTPKPGKVLTNNESHLSLEIEVDSKEKIINKSGSYKLRMNRSHNTSADVSSVKLRKIMRKGKSFITKTSSRFASLPLTTDSSILKDLSPISTSVDDLRANRNRSLKNSKNLISNNKNNPVAASSSILSTNIFESVSTNHSHAEEVPELVSTLSSSANISLRKRDRTSKHDAELSQLEVSTNGKKRLRSIQLIVNEQNASKKNFSILEQSGTSRQSNKTANDSKLFVEVQKDKSTLSLVNKSIEEQSMDSELNISLANSQSSPLKKHSRSLPHLTENLHLRRSTRKGDASSSITTSISVEESSATPIIKANSDSSIRRRGRSSKQSAGGGSSQMEISIVVKKRSPSLPSSFVDHVTPKQGLSILEASDKTRRSSGKGDDSVKLNRSNNNDSLFPSKLHDKIASAKKDSATPTVDTPSNTSIGRRGGPSQLSLSFVSSQTESSTLVKKRSRSLPSSSVEQVTPKQDLSILEDLSGTQRSSRRDTSKVLNSANTTPFLSASTLYVKIASGKKDSVTPTMDASSNTSIGRKGKPSKLSLTSDGPQMERSTLMKKRSRSLPSSSVDQITPKQDLSILEDISRTRRSSRRDTSKVLNNTNTTPFSSSSTVHEKTASGKKDSVTPANDESSNTSIGRKGKPSKLNLSPDSPQMERSTLIKKRSRSLPSSSVDQVTPKQDLSILEDISKTRRSSRRDTSKVLNHVNTDNSSSTHRTGGDKTLRKTVIDSSSLTPSTLLVTTASEKEVGSTSTFNASPTTNVVRKSRSSKLGGSSDNLQLETATFIKKRSSSLRTSSNNHVTNIQDLSIIEDSMLTRRHSIKEDNSKILNKSLKNSSLLSPSTSPDKSSSGIEGSASPINEPSFSGGAGRRSRASKLNASYSDSSLVEKSIVAKKYSQSSPSDVLAISKQDLSILGGSSCTRRSSRKGDDGVVLNKTNTDASITSTTSVKVKAISPLIKASSNAHSSVGRRDRSSKLIVSFDNLKLEKVIKKSSGSLPITSEMSSFVMDNKDHTRGGIRIGSASKTLKGTSSSSTSILNRTCSGAEVYATPNMSTLSSVSTKRSLPSSITSKDASAIIQNSRQITRKGDSGKISNKTSTRKSKKRKVDDVSPESDSTNRLFHGSGGDSVSPQAKKKVKFSAMDYSRMFDAFSSTPIHTKNPYLGSRSELKFMNSLMKLKKMQSPMGLSPIIGVNKNDSSVNDKSSQVSMKCLRYSECPNDIGEGSKSDSLVSRPSKNKSNKVSRSHNSIDLGVTDSSNYGTNNSKVKLGKKKSTRISTSQNELPYLSQTQVTSEHLSEKEGKSLQLPSKARKSVTNSLQDSNKEKMINITSSVRRKTPIVKLTPGKSKIGSRRIKKKGKKSVEERNAVPVPESCEREAQNTEASILHYEFSSNLNRPSTDVKNVGESILSSPKTSELNNLTAKSPVPKRRGRPQKVKNISKNSANKISPVIQRQGRSAKNTNLTPIVKSAEASPQKMPKKMKGRKTIVAEVPSSSSKGKEIRNLKSATEQISEDVERKSSISFPKTRSKVAVLALKTSRKSIIITSPIVKSPSLDRARVGKVKSENIQSPNAKKQGQSAKKDSTNVVSSSPAKRRGRSAINSSSNKREKLVTASPHLPKRGRLNKVQDNANEVIKESNTLPLKKRGRPAAKNDDSSPTKRGNSKYDLSNNNETLVSPSLSKRRGRSAKVQESNLSVSGKRKDRKISESTEDANTNSRRGRSVVKNSDSNKKAKSEKDSVNNHETIASPSLPKKGRPTKVQDNNLSASGKGKYRKISENTEGTNNTLRRGRSVVKNSDSSHNKKAKSEKDLENKVQETTDSRKKTKKNSDVEGVQTNMRRGRSAVKGQLSSPGKKTRLITQESTEGDANLSIDSPSPKRRGRPAKRITRKTFEKPTDNQSTLPLQKRGRSAVKNSDSSPVKRGKSNKDPIDTNAAVSSPPVPKRGRHAKIQDVTVSMKDASNNKDLDQNLSSKQRRGRSRAAGVGKNSPDRKVEAKQEIEKNIVNQIPSTSSSKNGRSVVLENVSPRKSRSVALKKKTSPVNKKQVTDNPLKMAGRRAKAASSPQPEVRKVSERSKAIKKSSKSKDMKPLKSAIKKRLSRKSSLMGPAFKNHGRRKVHFNKYVARNSNSKKK